jgi:hypothetical protein
MYGSIGGVATGGAAGATLAATGAGFGLLAAVVAVTTLIAAGLSLWKLAPRLRGR